MIYIGITLLSEISKANIYEAKIGSTQIKFIPKQLNGGKFLADTKTAGSICLLIQNSLPCLLFAKVESTLLLRGGTNASHAQQIEYFQYVFSPLAKRFGIETECHVNRRGYFPKGMGEVCLNIKPVTQLNPIDLTNFGDLKRIHIRSFVCKLPFKFAEIMTTVSYDKLKSYYPNVQIDKETIQVPDHESVGSGSGILIFAETTTNCVVASSELGERGVQSEKIAVNAVNSLKKEIDSKNCVDEYMQDQLIIFMALANGISRIRSGPLTLHTQTAIHYTELLTGAKFDIKKENENNVIIECQGINFNI
jgi:RNA 3'-terminal phosphate cyclase (ATP)